MVPRIMTYSELKSLKYLERMNKNIPRQMNNQNPSEKLKVNNDVASTQALDTKQIK